MEYLQYNNRMEIWLNSKDGCFKPYYKWNTFNTTFRCAPRQVGKTVLNLIINGIPSILAKELIKFFDSVGVLNLIINGIPSIQKMAKLYIFNTTIVLNLIINGIPSIRRYRLFNIWHIIKF